MKYVLNYLNEDLQFWQRSTANKVKASSFFYENDLYYTCLYNVWTRSRLQLIVSQI